MKLNLVKKIKDFKNYLKEERLLKRLEAEEKKIINKIKKQNLTYLSKLKLANIIYTIDSVNKLKNKGILVEAGCALGGSSILISSKKNISSKFLIFDVFSIIPPPTKKDPSDVHQRYQTIIDGKSTGLGDDLYYGYEDNLYKKVIDNLNSFGINIKDQNIHLVKGLVQDTMNICEPVAFAHIDVDWYEPVKTCLNQIWPNLVKGGCIILDDYHDWGGCRKATDEYFANFNRQFVMDDSFGSMKVTKL